MKIIVGNRAPDIPIKIEFCCSSMSLKSLSHTAHIASGMWFTNGSVNHFCPFCGRKVEIIVDKEPHI